MEKITFTLLLSCVLWGCAAPSKMFYQSGPNGEILAKSLKQTIWENSAPQGVPAHQFTLLKMDNATAELIQVLDRQERHMHRFHDVVFYVMEGYGAVYLEEEVRQVAAGSVIFVPHGVAHWFAASGGAPLIVLATFSPGYVGEDIITNPPQKLLQKHLKEEETQRLKHEKKMRKLLDQR